MHKVQLVAVFEHSAQLESQSPQGPDVGPLGSNLPLGHTHTPDERVLEASHVRQTVPGFSHVRQVGAQSRQTKVGVLFQSVLSYFPGGH